MPFKKIIGAGIVFVLVLPFVLLGVGHTAELSARPVKAPSRTIGCVLPLSGRYASYGNKALEAIIMAAGIFDVKKTPLRIAVADSQGIPEEAGKAVTRLAAESGLMCILGPMSGAEAEEAAREAQRLKVPIILLTQKEGLSAAGEYVFQNYLTAAMQVRALARYAVGELGLTRFAALYPESPYGHELINLFRTEVTRRGGGLIRTQSYEEGQTDFGRQIKTLTGMPVNDDSEGEEGIGIEPQPVVDFDAIFIPDVPSRAGMIAAQLNFYNVSGVQLLGTSAWNSPELLRQNSGDVNGAIFVDVYTPDSYYSHVNDFKEAFFKAYGREPASMEALVYDAAGIVASLLRNNQIDSRDRFRTALLSVKKYQGVTGQISFAGSREAQKEIMILQAKDDRIIPVR
ncbi:MAG: penicillin-binding protein activator [Smithellaceae bacterium]|nr:penicillin-binding protein activator [Smithellaceae bacterium]